MLTLRMKLLALMIGFAVVPGVAIALFALDTFADSSRHSNLEALAGLARAKADAIDQFIESRESDTKRLAELLGEPVAQLVAAIPAREPAPQAPGEPLPRLEDAEESKEVPGPATGAEPTEPTEVKESPEAAAARAELRQILGLALGDQEVFEELLIMDPDGQVMVSTFAGHEGRTAAELEYFKRGRAATYLQPVFKSPITEMLTMVIATPIRGPDNKNIGVLAARLNLKRFFQLINDYTGLGATGEAVVAKKIGEELVFMAPTRHDDDAALKRRVAIDSTMPIAEAASGDSGSGLIGDYRGEPVLAAWTFAPTIEWGVVAKIDVAEAAAPLMAVRTRVFSITLAVIALAVIVSLLVARTMIEPLRRLKNATEKISKGDLEVDLGISSRDEIGELADSFERMVAAIKFFREQSHGEAEDPEEEEEVTQPSGDEPPTRS